MSTGFRPSPRYNRYEQMEFGNLEIENWKLENRNGNSAYYKSSPVGGVQIGDWPKA
jgi:hypothetical protein